MNGKVLDLLVGLTDCVPGNGVLGVGATSAGRRRRDDAGVASASAGVSRRWQQRLAEAIIDEFPWGRGNSILHAGEVGRAPREKVGQPATVRRVIRIGSAGNLAADRVGHRTPGRQSGCVRHGFGARSATAAASGGHRPDTAPTRYRDRLAGKTGNGGVPGRR